VIPADKMRWRPRQFMAVAYGGNGCPLCGIREAHGHTTQEVLRLSRTRRDSDRSGEAGETALAGSTEGESAGRSDSEGIAQ